MAYTKLPNNKDLIINIDVSEALTDSDIIKMNIDSAIRTTCSCIANNICCVVFSNFTGESILGIF